MEVTGIIFGFIIVKFCHVVELEFNGDYKARVTPLSCSVFFYYPKGFQVQGCVE